MMGMSEDSTCVIETPTWLADEMATEEEQRRVSEGIGHRLQVARNNAGITQEQIAHACGLSRPQVANIEAGRCRIMSEYLITMCLLYKVSADDILGINGTNQEEAQ